MSAHPNQPAEHTAQAENKAREKDPHGVGAAGDAADHDAAAAPTDDRHRTETTAGS